MGSPLVIWYRSSLETALLCCCWDESVFGGKMGLCLEAGVKKWSHPKREASK
jgi:hypothetical protein